MQLPKVRPLFSSVQLITYKKALKIIAKERGMTFKQALSEFPNYIPSFEFNEDFPKDFSGGEGDSFPKNQEYIILEAAYDPDEETVLYEIGTITDGEIELLNTSCFMTEKMFRNSAPSRRGIPGPPKHTENIQKIQKFKKYKKYI